MHSEHQGQRKGPVHSQAVKGSLAMIQCAVCTVFSVHIVSVFMCAQCMWKSENNFEKLFLVFCLVEKGSFLFLAVYCRLVGPQASGGISCLHLSPHPRSAGIKDLC